MLETSGGVVRGKGVGNRGEVRKGTEYLTSEGLDRG